MTRRIFRSILCVSAAVLLASLVITLGVLYGYINVQQKNELRDETMYLAPGVVERGAEYLLQLEDTGKRITLIDRDGTVLYDNEADSQEMENHLQREEVQEALASGEGTASRHSDSLSEPTMYYARLLDNGQILRLSGSEYRMMTDQKVASSNLVRHASKRITDRWCVFLHRKHFAWKTMYSAIIVWNRG